MPYTAVQQLLDPDNPPGLHNYWKAELVHELSDELIDATVAHEREDGTVALGAAAPATRGPDRADPGRRERDHRAARRMDLHCIGEWETPEETEAELAWVRAWADVIAPFRMAGVPMTFSADTGDERVRARTATRSTPASSR